MTHSDPGARTARRYDIAELRLLLRNPIASAGHESLREFKHLLAEDSALLDLAAHARIDSVMPEFFVSVASYLNALDPRPELQLFFDRFFAGEFQAPQYELFRSHCLRHQEKLRELLSSQHVQTNNLFRSAVLLPAFCLAARAFPERSCAILDVGTSAGLHLLLDLYSYAYPELGGRVCTSRFASEVDLEMEFSWRGARPNDVATFFRLPNVTHRIGIDLCPIDLAVPGQRQWLMAFNDLEEGVVEGFLALRDMVGVRLVTGDAIDVLEPLVDTLNRDELPVIIHCFTTVQFTPEAKAALHAKLERIGADRDLVVISLDNELNGDRPVELRLRTYRDGEATEQCLARCEHRLDVGTWMEWLGPVD